MIRFGALLQISAPFRINAPLRRCFFNKSPHSNRRPRHSAKLPYSNIIITGINRGSSSFNCAQRNSTATSQKQWSWSEFRTLTEHSQYILYCYSFCYCPFLIKWRQVRKNIHSMVWTPGPTWSVLHPGGPPLLVPLSSCTGGYGPHPRRLIRTPVQGGYPRYHSILSPPRRASLLVPLSLDLSASLPLEFCPLPFVCFLCGTRHRPIMRKTLPIGRVY